MKGDIYCIVVYGANLNDIVRSALYITALVMVMRDENAHMIEGSIVHGTVTTEGERVPYGGVSGQKFVANLVFLDEDVGEREASVHFIVPSGDIESVKRDTAALRQQQAFEERSAAHDFVHESTSNYLH